MILFIFCLPLLIHLFDCFSNICFCFYTAISINVVASKRQAYATKPNGDLGLHWNLHVCVEENYKLLILCVRPERGENAFALGSHFSVAFLSLLKSFNCENSPKFTGT